MFWLALEWVILNLVLVCSHAIRRREWKNPALLISLCACSALLLCSSVSSPQKKFYNFSLMWVSTLMLAGFLLHRHVALWTTHPLWKMFLNRSYTVILCLSVVIQYISIYFYVPAFVSLSMEAPENGVIYEKLHAVSPLHYAKRQETILTAAAGCGIADAQSNRHVVVDSYTYMPLKETYQPLNVYFGFGEFDVSRIDYWHL